MKSTDQAARVRENQRKSRERKREYIASLESQIEAYKKEGAQRNVELQASARAVNEENRRLREENDALRVLLQQHGISQSTLVPPAESQSCSGPCANGSNCTTQQGQAADSHSLQSAMAPLTPSFDFTDFPEWSEFQPIVAEPIPIDQSISADSLPSICCSIAEPLPPLLNPPPTSVAMLPQFLTASHSDTVSSTPCRLAFRFLSDINERRSVKMDLFEIALFGLWNGFKSLADSSEGCAVDNEMLFSVATRLLQE